MNLLVPLSEFVQYFRAFLRRDFNWVVYLYTALFLTVAIILNYRYAVLITLLNNHSGSGLGFVYGCLFFGIAYYGVAIPKLLFAGRWRQLLTFAFYVRTGLLVCLVAYVVFSNTYDWLVALTNQFSLVYTKRELYYVFYNLSHIKFFLFWTFGSLIFYVLTPVYWKKPLFYGLTFRRFNFRLYLTLFAFMLPLLYMASLQAAFLSTYPILKLKQKEVLFNLSAFQLLLLFEFIYSLAFVGTEVVFRGAFVLGLRDMLDEHAVLPMASIYCFIHFNKPLLEALSSIFGGYVLGVLVLATYNVIGGILIHVGIAWAMDFLSLWRKGFQFELAG